MILCELAVAGAYVYEPERIEDERGFFARTFSAAEFAERGLESGVAECSLAHNHTAGTLRGLHYQTSPYGETKLVRCTRGVVYDVVVDLRPDSPTCLRWDSVELTAENRLVLYVPAGCAHGYLTLADGAELLYQMSQAHVPEAAAGVRWDDPLFQIEWPATPRVISPRDASHPDFQPPGASAADGL